MSAQTQQNNGPVASPLPLSFLGQAIASVSFSAVQLHWIARSQEHTVLLAVIGLTVPLQALATAMAFVARDAVAATCSGLLAGTWLVTATVTLTTPTSTTSAGLGVVLLASAGALLVPASAGSGRLVVSAVALLSSARFALTGIHELAARSGWQTASGWVGLVLCLVSVYAALAFEVRAAVGSEALPIGRRPAHAGG